MKQDYPIYKIFLLLGLLFSVSLNSFAQHLHGKVTDKNTGEPLVGATIRAVNAASGRNYATSAGLDGSYQLRGLSAGTYQVTANYISYQQASASVTVGNMTSPQATNFSLEVNTHGLNEVVIAGQGNRESDRTARHLEMTAPVIENILSANTIQLLPDVTVGNALQRVSGVTIQRSNNGEGRYAVIRGMDQRYNTTLVNGIKIPSPDQTYRFVPMDIFPSEMLERLEVAKALTPSMEGDAIGGVMNLVMKSAPDHFLVSANVSGGFSTLFSSSRPFSAFSASPSSKSPAVLNGNSYPATYADFNNKAYTSDKNLKAPFSSTAGLTIGDRFLNNRLGIVVSASYQNIYRGSDSHALVPNAQPSAQPLANTPVFSDAYDRTYSTQTERVGIHNKINYVFNQRNRLSLYNLYIHQNEFESRISADTSGLGTNSNSISKQVVHQTRNALTRQSIYNSTLHGDHVLSPTLRFNWDAVYSRVTRRLPDQTTFSYDANQTVNSAGVVTAEQDNDTKLTHHFEGNKDQDIAGYLNFIYNPKIGHLNAELSAGGLFRYKNRTADYIDYSFTGGLTLYNPATFSQIPFTLSSPQGGLGSNNTNLNNNYHINEDDNAEYVQLRFNPLPRLQVLGGARIENTYMDYATASPITVTQRSGTIKYTDVLPSIHLKYALADNQNLRASYFASISRPGFGEIVPYRVTTNGYYDLAGNPQLKHITADNYDLRYELFPGGADQILIGSFYKKIYNPIEYFVVRAGASPSDQIIKPQNDENAARNYGFEALVTKFFGVIGFSLNYTYTHSRITTAKLLYYQDPALGLQQTYVNETRPLQGQANNIGNASILFKSAKFGLDMQLAFVYTGERLAQVSPYANLDFYQHAYNQLDFSFEKILFKKLSFYGKINNLTNAASKIYLKYPYGSLTTAQEFLGKQDIKSQTLVQSDYYKTLFLGGFRYKF